MITGTGVTGWFVIELVKRDWNTIDNYLNTRCSGRFRDGVIREVCKRQRSHGIPISSDDELALIALYDGPMPPASFVEAWQGLQANK